MAIRLSIPATAEERQSVTATAKASGTTVTNFVRAAINAAAGETILPLLKNGRPAKEKS